MSKAEDLQSKAHKTAILVLGVDDEADRTMLRLLGALGCTLPADMRKRSDAQPLGGFEPAAVRNLNTRLLEGAGSSWDDVSPFHPEWRQSPGAKAFVRHAVKALEDQFGNAPLFALGGRDIPRLFPLWSEALRLFGCNVRPIVMLRNPLEVGQRAQDLEASSHSLAEAIWIRRALDAEHFSRGGPRYFASFERLCQSWDLVVQDAQEVLQLAWPKPPANVEVQIEEILAGLDFSKDLQARAMTSTLLPPWIRESYKILNGWAMSEEMKAHHGLLDTLRGEFDIAADAFGRVVRAERHIQLKIAETQRICVEEEMKALAQAVSASEAERAAFANERDSWKLEQDKRRTERDDLVSERDALVTERDALVAERDESAADRDALHAQLVLQRATHDDQSNALKAALQEQRRTTTLLNAQVQDFKERCDDLESELNEARAEVAATRARRKEMARVIANRDAQLNARYQELARLQKEIMRFAPVWQIKRSFGWLKRRFRGAASSETQSRG